MAAVAVVFDGTRVIDAESTTNWTAASATPTLEADFKYQNANSVSAQIKTSESGFYYRQAGTTHNFTTPKVWVAKVFAANKDVLDGNGLILEIGTGTRTAYYRYFIFSATTYPIAGGWQIVPIDPNIAAYRSATVGSPNLTVVEFFGVQADFSATSKSQNVALDAIDYVNSGTGLTLTGGDGGDADGTFTNFVTSDEGTSTNRWGIVSTRGGVLYVVGVLTIGTATATVFTDTNRVLVFPDGRFDTGFCGIDFGLQSSSSVISLDNCVLQGRGTQGTNDTRPDYTATGTSGTLAISGTTFNIFRNIDLTSTCTLTACTLISGLKLTQSSSTVQDCVIEAATTGDGVAFLISNNPANIKRNEFTFSDGHAIEITTAGTYTFEGNKFSGYGADGTNDAAVYNNSGGSVTLNITNLGDTPTVRNGAGASTTVNNAVNLTVTCLDESNNPVQNVQVAIYTTPGGTSLMNELTNASGVATESFNYTSNQNIVVRARKSTDAPRYFPVETTGQITSAGFSLQIVMQLDSIIS